MGILDDARSAMEVVGKRFESSEYFIPDLMMAGEILRQIADMVKTAPGENNRAGKAGKGDHRDRSRGYSRHRQGHRHVHGRCERL